MLPDGFAMLPDGYITSTQITPSLIFFIFFVPALALGLLPVLGPLGSGTDATHLPSPALRL